MAKQRPDIKEKYDGIYQSLTAQARAIIEAREGDGAHTFTLLKRRLPSIWAIGPELRKQGVENATLEQLEKPCFAFESAPCTWTENGQKITSDNAGLQVAFTRVMLAAVKRHIPENCGTVVDLGCGWGHRLFDLWLNGGPPSASYWGGERAEPGQKLLQSVSALFPAMKAKAFAFDFLAPSLAAIDDEPESVLVYTFHAIEQVKRIGPEFINAIIDRFPKAKITGVHLEPFGFQMHGDDPAWATDREYALRKHYNLDLYDQVSSNAKVQIIRVETGLLDLGGGNSTSSLVWQYRC